MGGGAAKLLGLGKSRLAGVLSGRARRALSERLLRHVLRTVVEAVGAPHGIVVSRDPMVLALARRLRLHALRERGAGDLNRALHRGADYARQRGARAVLLVLGDLPTLAGTGASRRDRRRWAGAQHRRRARSRGLGHQCAAGGAARRDPVSVRAALAAASSPRSLAAALSLAIGPRPRLGVRRRPSRRLSRAVAGATIRAMTRATGAGGAGEMVLAEAIAARRSIRRYRDQPIPDALLETLLTAAGWAPSAHNRQPWRFAVLRDGRAQGSARPGDGRAACRRPAA
ncbi:MAG: nitroreductase family protein [Pseudomonadota bacterium]